MGRVDLWNLVLGQGAEGAAPIIQAISRQASNEGQKPKSKAIPRRAEPEGATGGVARCVTAQMQGLRPPYSLPIRPLLCLYARPHPIFQPALSPLIGVRWGSSVRFFWLR